MKKTITLLLVCMISNGWLFANHWTPEDSQYADNMTLTGVIQINGVEQQSTTLEVGVFCGEECRGSVLPIYFFPTQRYVAQLTIFGVNGDQLTFKLFDHAMGDELNLTSPEAVTFVANGYGSLGDPYVLDFIGESDEITQTVVLSAGVNWVSFYVDITLENLQDALVAALSDTNIKITSRTQATTYNGSRWRGTLTALDITQMYMIEVMADCGITLEGMPVNPAEHPVTIIPGVNWIAFPFNANMTVTNVFAGFAINGDKVTSRTQSTTYNGSRWRGTLGNLAPGQGYIFRSEVSGNRTFTFPINTK